MYSICLCINKPHPRKHVYMENVITVKKKIQYVLKVNV